MNDLLKRLEVREKNLLNSILQIKGLMENQKQDLKANEESLNRIIGRQQEVSELISEIKKGGEK